MFAFCHAALSRTDATGTKGAAYQKFEVSIGRRDLVKTLGTRLLSTTHGVSSPIGDYLTDVVIITQAGDVSG